MAIVTVWQINCLLKRLGDLFLFGKGNFLKINICPVAYSITVIIVRMARTIWNMFNVRYFRGCRYTGTLEHASPYIIFFTCGTNFLVA